MRLSSATLRGFLGPTNPPIHQPAAGGATQECVDACAIVETASDATVVAKVELREVAMQMWLAGVRFRYRTLARDLRRVAKGH